MGNRKVPLKWKDALSLLKHQYATAVVIQAFAEVTDHNIVIVTENGVSCSYYIALKLN